MESHHASLGRRTLEEIRQKRASERLYKASSGSDSESLNPYGVQKLDSVSNRVSERETYVLQSRLNHLETRNAELERENRKLSSKLEEKEVETDALMKRVNDLEQNSLPSLKKLLSDVSIEKDAAIVAKEDALSQLRTFKKRIKEAEEEQYRAEEEAAALRAELNGLQQQVMGKPSSGDPYAQDSPDILAMQKEIMELRSGLQEESFLRQQDKRKLEEEQLRSSSLLSEKQELENKIAALSKNVSEAASEAVARKAFALEDKMRLENQLHDMALMVERLESSRQKLLWEIDNQSTEIERLFEENFTLTSSHQDVLGVAKQWEDQVKDCLKQNEELRSLLDKLRSEQISQQRSADSSFQSYPETEQQDGNTSSHLEVQLLKDQLVKEQSRAEALAAEVMKLSSELKRATQEYNHLTRLYRPVLRNIENNLMKMKQDNFVTIQ